MGVEEAARETQPHGSLQGPEVNHDGHTIQTPAVCPGQAKPSALAATCQGISGQATRDTAVTVAASGPGCSAIHPTTHRISIFPATHSSALYHSASQGPWVRAQGHRRCGPQSGSSGRGSDHCGSLEPSLTRNPSSPSVQWGSGPPHPCPRPRTQHLSPHKSPFPPPAH